jgi:extracellular factor (EF) 3-hydroxypalmitic acid methyl ester biosynthesis protein
LVTNVDASRPFRHSMEYLLEWHLIFRDRAQMNSLIPDQACVESDVLADPLQVNLYLEMRKSGASRDA